MQSSPLPNDIGVQNIIVYLLIKSGKQNPEFFPLSQEYFEEIFFDFFSNYFLFAFIYKKSIIDFAIFLGSSESSIIPHSFLSLFF